MIKYLSKIKKKDLLNKRVVLRLDLNVPIKEGKITSDFRIQKILKTLEFLKETNTKTIIISHISNDEGSSLYPVYEYLKKDFDISFIEDAYASESIGRAQLKSNFIMIENIRNWEGEKSNDTDFSEYLASLGDIYINDAFSVCHREHASIVGIPQYLPSIAGFQLEEEIKSLSKVSKPIHPFSFILGGAKFETKIPLIKKYGIKADLLYLGGALANDIHRSRGESVGKSLVSDIDIDEATKGVDITVSESVIVKGKESRVTNVSEIKEDESILDVDPESLEDIKGQILESKMIVWNGPLGLYEEGFVEGTKEMAKIIAESEGFSIIGGGDTISAITELDLLEDFSFISTGGGAMLQYLTDGTLVGLEPLKRKFFLEIFKIFRK